MCTKQSIINSLEMLAEEAFMKTMKYRFDPVIGPMHEKYLTNFNILIDYAKREGVKDVS